MGTSVLVGDAVLELVRLRRQFLLLVGRRGVLGFRRVFWLYVRGGVMRNMVGRGVSSGDTHDGEKNEALNEEEFVSDNSFFQLSSSLLRPKLVKC